MAITYSALTPEDQQHFLTHGWIHLQNACRPEALDYLLEHFWTRMGADPKDKSTWPKYSKMPRHREVKNEDFFNEWAWKAICEIVGGEDRIDAVRERYQGDQFIFNGGGDERKTNDPRLLSGWHTDNDWYRQFITASGNALTLIVLFSDVPSGGGGTWVAEDGIAGLCEWLMQRPEGVDPPFEKDGIYGHVTRCASIVEITGKKGDVFVTHGLLPHCSSENILRNPRIITNPHVNLAEPYNLDRADPGDYSLVEQVILRALNVSCLPASKYSPTRSSAVFFPGASRAKVALVPEELDRLERAAAESGGTVQSPWLSRRGAEGTGRFPIDMEREIANLDQDSISLDTQEDKDGRREFFAFLRRNGLDRPWSEGVQREEEERANVGSGPAREVGAWMWQRDGIA
ncbi:hypothetical protein DACRYDRAFT_59431 [Dacryopinax primogenitus]|uniref:Clavaminate synthase-like protein n=1 Tax=Dacryopinax primogenitus (strain DJM 731) TaxID=1858805 RepID=M5FPG4_DACPD|nr:uncharacterized protein DACRYDRAFT_59431 [Dacryopinax primogenitus]EJT97058.1 hypothetical protein DACRYDRAFT_59431 [Dacryopinax primogenitus]